MKRIVLCADDYGQSEGITQGILSLVRLKRLSAVSVLVNGSDIKQAAEALLPYANTIDIGLHLNFTEGTPLSPLYRSVYGPAFSGLRHLLPKALARWLKKAPIDAEIEAQLLHFKSIFGFWPQFIDGHQHVHHFPVIREGLLAAYLRYLPERHTYMRLVYGAPFSGTAFGLKACFIQMTGAKAFLASLQKHEIPHNSHFSGIYDFAPKRAYSKLFPQFLIHIQHKGLILCHPAAYADAQDPIGQARISEWHYFKSDAFLDDCVNMGIQIEKFSIACG